MLLADLLNFADVASQLLHSLFSLSDSLLTCLLQVGIDLLLELVGLNSVLRFSLIDLGISASLSESLVVDVGGNGVSALDLSSLQFLLDLFESKGWCSLLGFLFKSLLDGDVGWLSGT